MPLYMLFTHVSAPRLPAMAQPQSLTPPESRCYHTAQIGIALGDDAIAPIEVPIDVSTSPPPPSESLAKAMSSMLDSVLRDFDSKAGNAACTQDHLCSAIDRFTTELDQLLEDAPLAFIVQHAAKISGVRKRVSSLNMLLKSIQQRVHNIDLMLFMRLRHVRVANESYSSSA